MNEENTIKKRRKKSFKRIFKHKLYRLRNLYCLVCFILSMIACFMIAKVGVFPFIYPIILFVFLFIINFISMILINVHRKNVLKIVGYILLSMISILCIVLFFYVNVTIKFFDNNFSENTHIYEENTYYILGKNTISYTDDMMVGNIGVLSHTYNLENVSKRVNEKYSFDFVDYTDVSLLFDDIQNDKISFVLIDKSLYHIFFLLSDYKESNYNILDTLNVYTKKNKTNHLHMDYYNIYLKALSEDGFNDLNVIVTMNHKTNQALFTYIPENSYLVINDESDKLKYLNIYGTNTTRSVIEKLLDIDIDYSLVFQENKMTSFVQYLGGINYCSDEELFVNSLSMDSLKINEGCNRIDGEEALLLSQYEENRLDHNILIALGILDEVFDIHTLTRFNSTLNTFGNVMDTDMSEELVKNIIRNGFNHQKWDIEKQNLEGVVSKKNVCLSSMEDDVLLLDSNSVRNASNKIKETLK